MENWKCLTLRLKMPYLGIFGLKFQRIIIISDISTIGFATNESLTHTVDFGIGSAFSEDLLYKVCAQKDCHQDKLSFVCLRFYK